MKGSDSPPGYVETDGWESYPPPPPPTSSGRARADGYTSVPMADDQDETTDSGEHPGIETRGRYSNAKPSLAPWVYEPQRLFNYIQQRRPTSTPRFALRITGYQAADMIDKERPKKIFAFTVPLPPPADSKGSLFAFHSSTPAHRCSELSREAAELVLKCHRPAEGKQPSLTVQEREASKGSIEQTRNALRAGAVPWDSLLDYDYDSASTEQVVERPVIDQQAILSDLSHFLHGQPTGKGSRWLCLGSVAFGWE